jgi:BirA family biotin operon repressor/biotin-[acetyl-CoA-carboxylase] ligase
VSHLGQPLNHNEINNALAESYWRVNVVEETGSTQTDLSQSVRAGKSHHGDVLATEFQSAGRGRLDRKFEAPPRSSLLFSFFIKPKSEDGEWGWLPLLAGQSVVSAMENVFGDQVIDKLSLKWPNDVLLNGKKVAGILSERVEGGAVIGIGLNVITPRDELGFHNATSLWIEGFLLMERELLLVEILKSFALHLSDWENNSSSLVDNYRAVSSTIGKRVRIEVPSGHSFEEDAVDVEPSGALILSDGTRVTVGDIVHLYQL